VHGRRTPAIEIIERKIYGQKSGDSVYKVVELVGTSAKSWEEAAKNAVETAAATLRDLRVGEIVKLDMTVDDGKGDYVSRSRDVSFKLNRKTRLWNLYAGVAGPEHVACLGRAIRVPMLYSYIVQRHRDADPAY